MGRFGRVVFTLLMLAITLAVPLFGVRGLYAYLADHGFAAGAFSILIALINFGIYYFVFLAGGPQKPKINKRPGYKYCEECTQEMGLLSVYCCYCGEVLKRSKEAPSTEHIAKEDEFAKTVGGRCSDAYHGAILKQLNDEKLLYPHCFCAICGKCLL